MGAVHVRSLFSRVNPFEVDERATRPGRTVRNASLACVGQAVSKTFYVQYIPKMHRDMHDTSFRALHCVIL